jgi:hypothetical protein
LEVSSSDELRMCRSGDQTMIGLFCAPLAIDEFAVKLVGAAAEQRDTLLSLIHDGYVIYPAAA